VILQGENSQPVLAFGQVKRQFGVRVKLGSDCRVIANCL
jgi:hypothetical protein